MGEQLVDWGAYRSRDPRPAQAAPFGQLSPTALESAREGVGFDQDDMREMLSEALESLRAPANHKGQRATRGVGQAAKAIDMPIDAIRRAGTRPELEGDDFDLRALTDEAHPTRIVAVGTGVEMQR